MFRKALVPDPYHWITDLGFQDAKRIQCFSYYMGFPRHYKKYGFFLTTDLQYGSIQKNNESRRQKSIWSYGTYGAMGGSDSFELLDLNPYSEKKGKISLHKFTLKKGNLIHVPKLAYIFHCSDCFSWDEQFLVNSLNYTYSPWSESAIFFKKNAGSNTLKHNAQFPMDYKK